MNKKQIFYSNKPQRKNVIKISPKIPAKRPDFSRNNNLKGQISAQMNRKRIEGARLESPFYSKRQAPIINMNKSCHILNDDQIKNSAMYKILEEEIKQLANRKNQEIEKLKKIKQEKLNQASKVKKSQFQTKLQIYELKRQFFDLKDVIEEERQETQRLEEELQHLFNGNDHQFQSQADDYEQVEESSIDS